MLHLPSTVPTAQLHWVSEALLRYRTGFRQGEQYSGLGVSILLAHNQRAQSAAALGLKLAFERAFDSVNLEACSVIQSQRPKKILQHISPALCT